MVIKKWRNNFKIRGEHNVSSLKILNNNTILAKEDDNEIIVMAKGIGFGKKIDEHFEIPPHAKKYMMQKNYQAKDKQKKVIDYINPVYLEIAAEIIKEATNKFEQVNHDILIPLADHIHFTIKRMDEISCLVIHLPMIYDFFSLMNMKLL